MLKQILIVMLIVIIFMVAFISKRKHLLATLLSLEGLMLFLFVALTTLCFTFGWFPVASLMFIVLAACEGGLGLSLLVVIVRCHGGDQFNSMNFLQC